MVGDRGPTLAQRLVAGRAEGPFDAQADLLHRLVGGELALVTVLHGGAQHNVGIGGATAGAVPRDVPDRVSLCPGTMRRGDVVAVPDMAVDDEFATHPACAELGLRGYLGAPLRMPDGQVVGTVCVVDARPVQWAENHVASLVAVRDHVERIVEATVDDLSGLSDLGPALRHELGGDLSVLLSAVETALLPLEEEARGTVLRQGLRHGRRLATVLDALLALGARAPVHPGVVDVRDLLDRLPGHDAGRLRTAVPPGLRLVCEGTLLERLVANLVENALKHTEGGVEVTASATPGGVLEIVVADEGDGLPQDAQVFEAFVRGGGDRDGFGFGLHLVRRLALRLGAEVRVVSGTHGTTFTVCVSGLEPVGEQDAGPSGPGPGQARKST